NIRRAIQVFVILGSLAFRPDGLCELLAVVRELEQGVIVIVDHPDVFVRIIGIDVNGMRSPEKRIPLRPLLGDVAIGIYRDEQMFPARVDAHPSFPGLGGIGRIGTRTSGSRWAGGGPLGGVAERHLAYRKGKAWPDF